MADLWRCRCTFTAENGAKIGWKPQYKPEHILEAAEEEVDLILGATSKL
jgi:hypothetical protein